MEQVLLFHNVSITTPYENFYPVLGEYKEFDRCNRSELVERLGLSPGQSSRIFHDGRLLGLWDGKLQLLSLGRQWQREIKLYGRPSPESLRQAAMNVPLFALTCQAIPNERDAEKIMAQFRTITNARKQDYQSAAKRYREALFGSDEKPIARSTEVHEERTETPVVLPRAAQLVAKYLQLMQEFGPGDVAACHDFVYQVRER